MSRGQKPGQTPRRSGEYRERGPHGGGVHNPRTVTMPAGDKPLPPTQRPGHTWEYVSSPQTEK